MVLKQLNGETTGCPFRKDTKRRKGLRAATCVVVQAFGKRGGISLRFYSNSGRPKTLRSSRQFRRSSRRSDDEDMARRCGQQVRDFTNHRLPRVSGQYGVPIDGDSNMFSTISEFPFVVKQTLLVEKVTTC
ncbi:hypothetical protein MRX96_011943 [Rhipicephalus microplus]